MNKDGDKVNIDRDEARAGTTPHVLRYILGISLALAIIAMLAILAGGFAAS